MRVIIIGLILLVSVIGCKDNEVTEPAQIAPEIVSLTASKTEIKIGEISELKCEAKGENLEYLWNVFLGDIVPVNADASIVNYSGYECCAGPKTITCKVKNEAGEVTESIVINVLE